MAQNVGKNVVLNYSPTDKQKLLHNAKFQQCLFGGAAGGGKSRGLRWDLIQWCITIPGIQCYLFRKTFPQLDDNHVRPIRHELPESVAHYNVSKARYEFFNGAMILMCHCEEMHDYLRYQGAEMHVLAIDEASLFFPLQIIELRSRVRLGSFREKVPAEYLDYLPRFICSSNPGGPSHAFLKRTFISPSQPFKIFHDPSMINPDMPGDKGWSTLYIKSQMKDNPHLDLNYGSVFSAMAPERARALRDGDWDAVEGMALHLLSHAKHEVRPFEIPAHWERGMSLDWGTAAPFSVGWYCVVGEPTHVRRNPHIEQTGQNPYSEVFLPVGAVVRYDELYGWTGKENEGLRLDSITVAKMIVDYEKEKKMGVIGRRVADNSMWSMVDGPSPAEKMMTSTGGKIILHKCKKDRIANYDEINARLAGNPFLKEGGKQGDAPMFFITSNCIQAWRTLPTLLLDPLHPDKGPAESGEDHIYSEIAYFLQSRPMITTQQQHEHDEYLEARRAIKQTQADAYRT